jgi:hypothetical protein
VGSGFWILSGFGVAAKDIYFMGQVVSAATQNISIVTGYQLLSYPYSCDFQIGSCGLTNGTSGANPSVSDNILTWDSAGQMFTVYWLSPTGWYQGAAPAGTATIKAGQAFWYKAMNPYTWIEPKPYAY